MAISPGAFSPYSGAARNLGNGRHETARSACTHGTRNVLVGSLPTLLCLAGVWLHYNPNSEVGEARFWFDKSAVR